MVIYYCSPNVVFSFSCYSLHIVFFTNRNIRNFISPLICYICKISDFHVEMDCANSILK